MCPGHCKTGAYTDSASLHSVVLTFVIDLGGARATLEPSESVEGQLRFVAGLKPEHSGRFWRYNGEAIPW